MANAIMHFEIPADDVERAKRFYERVFGWKIEAYPMPPGQEYWGVSAKGTNDEGINGGLMKRQMPGQPFTNYVTVESIDVMIPTVQANGGRVALPKQEIGGGMGWIAAFIDPENNLIGLHQPGPNAQQATPKKPVRKAAAKKAPAKRAAKRPAKKTARAAKKSGKKRRR
jgi:predicted enzyme related to lactoylglutathione lyase